MDQLREIKKEELNPEILSKLPQEELISQLIKARTKIQELEQAVTTSQQILHHQCSQGNYGKIRLEEDLVIQDVPTKFRDENKIEDIEDYPKLSKSTAVGIGDELIIAFKHQGIFPRCDEDLSLSYDLPEQISNFSEMLVHHDVWEEEDDEMLDCGSSENSEEFPLIPSPVLNTPPYEYIFVTRENEAKCRIFLNPKLNKVFQEELTKLKIVEERNKYLKGSYQSGVRTDSQNFMDLHNQNHIINASPSEIDRLLENNMSCSNVIHCFDPSEVDLELKKIFTEKPPVTHKIVRRKSRKERGSSVPAVDSYYGTKDLNKVGHASYFIPLLTESERKSIGWKSDYHYGHWKYDSFNAPNVRTNPISLHPHPHPEERGKRSVSRNFHSYHNHYNNRHCHYHVDPLLSQNPLHQKEINLSETDFLIGSEAQSLLESRGSPDGDNHNHNHKYNHSKSHGFSEDPLSFITLSGCPSDPSAVSCHIIPDKCALRRILKWLLPSCTKEKNQNENSSLLPSPYPNASYDDKQKGTDGSFSVTEGDKRNHEIQTLVGPSSKLIFPASDTNMSITLLEAQVDKEKNPNNNKSETHQLPPIKIVGGDNNKGHHSHHHHHHHHHGFFHWKHILNHGSMKGTESMSVVGGDVVDSGNTSDGALQLIDVVHKEVVSCVSGKSQTGSNLKGDNSRKVDSESSSDDEEDLEENKKSSKDRRNGKKLKSCRAYERLLTLRDLGYESDDVEGIQGEFDIVPKADNNYAITV